MAKNLVVVESPAKAKTIEGFLGKDYKVISSFGHIRDLPKKNLGIQIENNFTPNYEVSLDKKKVVEDLIKQSGKSETVWLATDEDREGEAISWHLFETLKLKKENTKRIAFHEITKKAITYAIQNPREINIDLVNAQQARRILDRIVGFKLSPVLWKKVKSGLSAGRVQSVAVRLIAERESEIKSFVNENYFSVQANFYTKDGSLLSSVLNCDFKKISDLKLFLEDYKNTTFKIDTVTQKPSKKRPSAPFITSTLQQVASSKFGYSVSKTMTLAQRLYEAGKITYMRTDSTNISDDATNQIKNFVVEKYGQSFFSPRSFSKKTKNAQEAHEAIRPTNIQIQNIEGDESKLYDLIWRRTVASQMADAQSEITTIKIIGDEVSDSSKFFTCKGEVIKFKGFLEVDPIDSKNSDILPKVEENQKLNLDFIVARQKFKKPKGRYNEASLVKKLEELGIGRPSTYAPTISVIQKRGYVEKRDTDGNKRKYLEFILKNGSLIESEKEENFGVEKRKLFPTDIGLVTNQFLMKHFSNIIDFNFTANVEQDFDNIANGKLEWSAMIKEFYFKFDPEISKVTEFAEKFVGTRNLGIDPKSGKNVYVRIGRYGPMVQIGETDDEEKPKFTSLQKNQSIEDISLEEALNLFMFPKTIGHYELKEVVLGRGRFGPYIKFNNSFISIKDFDINSITLDECIDLIEQKKIFDKQKNIHVFDSEEPVIEVLNGRYGPYIKSSGKNYKIPKSIDPKKLSRIDCLDLISNSKKGKKK